MNKRIYLSTLFAFLLFYGAYSQIITVTPPLPTDADGVEVVFDATQGNAGLQGYTGDVYAHTGVITNLSTGPSDWKYVKSPGWGINTPECKLSSLGNNKWKLVIGPSIREYYGVPASEQIEKLAFVFRSATQVGGAWLEGKTATGGDIFYDVYPSGVSVKITNPDQALIFAQLNVPFSVSVSSVMADTTILYNNNIRIATTTGNSITQSITPTEYGRYLIKAIAKSSTGIIADSFYYYVRPASPVAELPQGMKDGINYLNDTTALLCLYAPLKEYVFAVGDFNNWLPDEATYMNRTPDGKRYWIQLNHLIKKKEYIFQYLVDGSISIGDPYAAKVSDPWNDSYIDVATYPGLIQYPTGKASGVATFLQTAQTPYTWQSTNFTPAANTDLVVYELLIRDFTAKHTFQSLIDTLGYLEKLGVNAIELMPVNEFEGNLSWGYNPNYYCALDKYYGPADTYKKFIDKCHQKGIAVLMDIALNHSFGTSPYVKLYWDAANNRPSAQSPFYNPVPKHDFNVGYDMNHESADTKAYVNRILEYWITEFRVDGFRFDLSKGFTQNNTLGNTAAWGNYDASRINILSGYHDVMTATNPNSILILEHFADNSEEKELSNRGMLLWGNINNNYSEAAMGYAATSDLSWGSYKARGWTNPNLVSYMESHDEERQMFKCITYGNASGTYSTKDTTTAMKRAELTSAFFLTIPGPKMIWQFGEMGYDYSINYPSGTSDSRTDSKPPRWDYMSQYRRSHVYKTYAGLAKLKVENAAFRSTDFTTDLTGGMKKIKLQSGDDKVVVLGNFGVTDANITPDFFNSGVWYDYLTGDSITVSVVTNPLKLKAGEARVYLNKHLANPFGFADNDKAIAELTVFPNPVVDFCRIHIKYPGNELYQLRFLSLSGLDVDNPVIGEVNKDQEFLWKPKSSGLFLVRLQIGEKVVVKKVLVQ
ncbi:MAG: hypothetical protein HXX13_16025 [Bacteroidetes bacterium]|nr:hypothetical protein [Bacteroidota bacterium]